VQGYGSRFIQNVFGIPISTLHSWDKKALVKPELRPAAGRGSRRLYSFQDLVQLLVLSRLRDMGVSLQRIRKCLDFLRRHFPELQAPLAELSFVTDGETVFVLTADPHTLLDTLHEQFVWSLPIAGLISEARAKVEGASQQRTETIRLDGRNFTVTIEQDPEDGWWIGLVKELPGCGSQGSTLEELREMLADAIHSYLIVQGEIAEDAEEEKATRAPAG